MSTAGMIKRGVQHMGSIHKVAVIGSGLLAVATAVLAFSGLWALATVCVVLMLLGVLSVVVFGNEEARRRLFSNSIDLPAPQQTNVTDAVSCSGQDPTLSYWGSELRRGGRLQWFAALARETKSVGARDVLALSASNGASDYASLMRKIELLRFRGQDFAGQSELQQQLWLPAYFSLARVLYSQRLNDQDLFNCLSMYAMAEKLYGLRALSDGIDRSYYSDLLTWNGEFAKASQVLEYSEPNAERAYSQRYLKLNTQNPNVTEDFHKAAEWTNRLGDEFKNYNLAPIAFQNPEVPSFYEIVCDAAVAEGTDLPLVTVIMPIYEPNDATDVAIRSLLNQTWRNLEIIIIDDASPRTTDDGRETPYRQQLQGWAEQDSRIKLILCEENRGAYSVRNDAFEAATGEFVTIADKDDWHHPQRIERQARDLMKHKNKHANIVQWVRVDADMKFQVRWGPDRVIHPSFACIMYRRNVVMERLGYWDPVRKSADNEYRRRFELVFNTKLISDDPIPMAFSLLGDDNLTSNDFGLGYRHPDREIYQESYGQWHQDIRDGASPVLSKNIEKRGILAPPSFLPKRDKNSVPHFDVIYASEFGLLGGTTAGIAQEIKVALDAGLRVGILALQNGLVQSASKRRIVPEIKRLIAAERVEWLTLERNVTASLMVLHWPTVMELKTSGRSRIDVKHLVAVVDQLPAELNGKARYYSLEQVSNNCLYTFGLLPQWFPQTATVRTYVEGQLPPKQLATDEWPSTVGYLSAPKQQELDSGRFPIIGRPVDETETHWPSKSVRHKVYPTSGSFHVALRSNLEALKRQGVINSQGVPDLWTVEDPSHESFEDYLAGIDFLLYYADQPWHVSLEPSVLAAIKAGVVVVLEPSYAETYGEGAVYAEANEVRRVVLDLWRNPEKYRVQQQRAFEFLRENRGPQQYISRLRGIIGETAANDEVHSV